MLSGVSGACSLSQREPRQRLTASSGGGEDADEDHQVWGSGQKSKTLAEWEPADLGEGRVVKNRL